MMVVVQICPCETGSKGGGGGVGGVWVNAERKSVSTVTQSSERTIVTVFLYKIVPTLVQDTDIRKK